MADLFNPLQFGAITAPNRIFMAPLTRCRAGKGHVPTALMAEYYAQRASAGLIIAEATMAMAGNSAFWHEPGIYSAEQVAGWKLVTDAVHAAGGRIFLQASGKPPRTPKPPASTASRCMAPTATCSTSSCATAPTSAAAPTAAAWKTGRGCCSR